MIGARGLSSGFCSRLRSLRIISTAASEAHPLLSRLFSLSTAAQKKPKPAAKKKITGLPKQRRTAETGSAEKKSTKPPKGGKRAKKPTSAAALEATTGSAEKKSTKPPKGGKRAKKTTSAATLEATTGSAEKKSTKPPKGGKRAKKTTSAATLEATTGSAEKKSTKPPKGGKRAKKPTSAATLEATTGPAEKQSTTSPKRRRHAKKTTSAATPEATTVSAEKKSITSPERGVRPKNSASAADLEAAIASAERTPSPERRGRTKETASAATPDATKLAAVNRPAKAQTRRPRRSKGASRSSIPIGPQADQATLLAWLRDQRPGVRSGSGQQINIVSRELCDDVLARLGPSLARHANCDIIDLNPGIGIWSTAVHEIVKPRTHILVEPEEKYMPFLRPLLERAGSRYRLYAPRFIMNDNFRDLARADYLSGQQRLRPGDPGHANRNDTLLLIGNMGEFRPKAHYLFPRYKTLMMYHMVKAVRTQVDLSSYGLVRMLLWMSEQEKRTLLPRSIVLRKRSQIEAEMNMEYVHEIAGTDGTLNKGKRPDDFELSQTVQVVKGMAERGVDTPLHRKLDSQREAEMFLATGAGSASAGLGDGIRRAWQDELLALDQAVQDGRLQASSRKEGDPIYARYRYLRQWAGQMRNKKQQVDTVIDLACGPVHDGPSGGASSRRVLTDAGSVAKLRQHVDKLGYLERGMVFTVLDEHLGRQRQPPLLMWDRRLDHPLAVHVEDFFPHEPLTLIDMQPRAMPALLTQDAAAQEVYEYLLSGLFRHGRLSFPDALEALAPNSFDGVAMHVPLLRDPAQGGYPDLHMMRPRTLSPEMLLAMVEAWQRWPFRPPRRRLLRSMVDSLADTALDLDEWKW